MASHISMTFRSKGHTAISDTMHFRRKDKQTKTKKMKKKIKIKARHFVICFLFVGGLFFGVQRAYLFLISWDKLNVTRIDIQCTREGVRNDIERFFQGKYLGNLLLLDIGTLKENILRHPWIKEVHMRKSFPSSVNILIKERIPVALMKSESLYLIDKDGIKLQKVDPQYPGQFPIFIDNKNFAHDTQAKLDLAWACLDSLQKRDQIEVAFVDLSEYDNVRIKLKGVSTWIIFGHDRFEEKMEFFLARQNVLQQYGPLEYVDLRFKDRLYIKPHENWAKSDHIHANKEAD
jgi:cell division septal protein FtsQ